MFSSIFLGSNNPILPGYPVIFGGWGSQPYCDTLHKSEKQCFEDCMTANGHAASIDVANSITPACPPLIQQQHGCVSTQPVAFFIKVLPTRGLACADTIVAQRPTPCITTVTTFESFVLNMTLKTNRSPYK